MLGHKLIGGEVVGRAIVAARTLAGMDQATFAAHVGIAAATLSPIERGEGSPRDSTMEKIYEGISDAGVAMHWDRQNCIVQMALRYERRIKPRPIKRKGN